MRQSVWAVGAILVTLSWASARAQETRLPMSLTADRCQDARDELEFTCFIWYWGRICSDVVTTETQDLTRCTVSFTCCYTGCGPDCPPGFTQSCVGDQMPDECGCCVNWSPIVIDLDGDGTRFGSADAGVLFDINGTGRRLRVAWPEGGDDAWLALDRNGDGLINDGSELFGNATRLANGSLAQHGYQALAERDDDGDGTITATDAVFGQLRLWRDLDRNGIGEPAELSRLEEHGIVGLSLDVRESARRDRWGNRFRYRAKVLYVQHREKYSYDVFPVVRTPGG